VYRRAIIFIVETITPDSKSASGQPDTAVRIPPGLRPRKFCSSHRLWRSYGSTTDDIIVIEGSMHDSARVVVKGNQIIELPRGVYGLFSYVQFPPCGAEIVAPEKEAYFCEKCAVEKGLTW
jgi:hypothetical protein